MKIEIGSYEAKTKLPELLRGTQAGKHYTITLRGQAVAELVPAGRAAETDVAGAVEQMRQLALGAKPVKGLDLKGLIGEGRA